MIYSISRTRAAVARLFLTVWIAIAVAGGARAEDATDITRAPTLTIERHPEDWSGLADPANRTGRWPERFRYVPLNADGSAYLSMGLEARSRYESYDNTQWGDVPDDAYTWHRLMPYFDLHVGKVRLFLQPIITDISGAGRAPSPVDTTRTDILQTFVEMQANLTADTTLRFSAGRKMQSLGAGRFVDTRYGPNVPRAFDGVDATLADQTGQITALYLRPVTVEPGNFDDRASHTQAIWGIYATRWFNPDHKSGVDLFYLGFRDTEAVFDQGSGSQRVHTIGSRLFADTGRWFWNLEGAFQRGTFAGGDVSAWGVGAEAGHRLLNAPLTPEFALTLDVVSGDNDPNDTELNTMNTLFPRGKYFVSQSPVGPRNLIHFRPTLTVYPHKDVAVTFTAAAYWRESTNDGVYAMSGNLVRSGSGSAARFVGSQFEIGTSWQATEELNISATLGVFEPGTFIEETGSAETITTMSVAATFRF